MRKFFSWFFGEFGRLVTQRAAGSDSPTTNPNGIESFSPGLARRAPTLGIRLKKISNPNGVVSIPIPLRAFVDETLSGFIPQSRKTQGSSRTRNLGLNDRIPSGFKNGTVRKSIAIILFRAIKIISSEIPAVLVLLSSSFVLAIASHGATIVATDSIQRALNEARDGDTILLQGPRVFREHVVIDKPIRLVGTNSPTLDAGGTGTTLTIQSNDVEIRGLNIRNSGKDLAGFDSAVMIFGSRANVHDCDIQNDGFGIYIRGANECVVQNNKIFGTTNVISTARGNGIHLWKTKKNLISGNTIRQKRDGIYLSYADDNILRSNRVEESRFGIHYMYSHRNQLLANTLTANSVGATLMFARNCVVEGNQVFANRRHGMLFKQVESSRISRNYISGQNRGLFVQQADKDRFEENVIEKNDIGVYLSGGSEQNIFVGNAFVQNTDQIWQPPDEVELGRRAANAFYENGRGNFWSDYTGVAARGDGIGDTPYHETDAFGYIVDRHPEARVFALSPAVALLRKSEEILPLIETTGVTDLFPLMKPRSSRREEALTFSTNEVNSLTSAATKRVETQ
jgi:nitrous oxidase accessory protein